MTMHEPTPLPDELAFEAEESMDSPLAGLTELPAEVYFGGAAGLGLLGVASLLIGKRGAGILLILIALLFGVYGQQRQSEELEAFDELEMLPPDDEA